MSYVRLWLFTYSDFYVFPFVGAYLVPYLILLLVIGIPLFFLELSVGQRIRRGSIGVWNYISPKLGGIGFASCIVSFLFVCLFSFTLIHFQFVWFRLSVFLQEKGIDVRKKEVFLIFLQGKENWLNNLHCLWRS